MARKAPLSEFSSDIFFESAPALRAAIFPLPQLGEFPQDRARGVAESLRQFARRHPSRHAAARRRVVECSVSGHKRASSTNRQAALIKGPALRYGAWDQSTPESAAGLAGIRACSGPIGPEHGGPA